MRSTLLLLLLTAGSATAVAQPDLRSMTYKGPVQIALPCRTQDLSVRHVSDDAAMGAQDLLEDE
jgi:hypothetical protein